jgi:hypothetical protein
MYLCFIIYVVPPTTIVCFNMDVSGHILVSSYIHIKIDNSGRRKYQNITFFHMMVIFIWRLMIYETCIIKVY